MQSFPYKGQLKTWKDDRGFGFIKPDDGSKEVFLHISVLKGASRRPIIGDTIFYEKTTEANGKIRASKASIKGVINQPTVSNQRSRNSSQVSNQQSMGKRINGNNPAMQKIIPIIFLIGLGISSIASVTNFVRGCNIKGNISVNTGSKLYHLPNMEDYATTNIDVSKGEKWFCTESEAIASGWSKAPR
ncbi:cold shock domain-containing protein [Pseudanabaena sp. Chao 1811]|uniref:cold shock domain-containing protein n=1 Tax=Pseudanabaena sp. Chao 1811 TaxID=2963092 RepID=UPI0022F3F946|nr:cold shock domain-containing protein [Pseudanabaena sp. Chao 1811]